MSYDYTEFVTSLQTELVIQDPSGIANLAIVLPRIIEYAELRMYREFDFLATRTRDSTQQSTIGIRQVPIPPQLLVIEEVSVVIPAGAQPADAGAERVTLLRTSRQFLDLTWPQESLTSPPVPFETYYAIFSEQEQADEGTGNIPNAVLIGPTLDGNYHVEFAGTFRPQPLSEGNPNTILTALFPDAFFAAAMISAAGYQRDYGRQSDDPQMAMSWEAIYQGLKPGITIEEGRKLSLSVNATTAQPRLANSAAPPAGQ
jgi:hypothetical protein